MNWDEVQLLAEMAGYVLERNPARMTNQPLWDVLLHWRGDVYIQEALSWESTPAAAVHLLECANKQLGAA